MEREIKVDKLNRRKVHIAPPATASEIIKAVGVTNKDMQIVSRVLQELYPQQFPIPKEKKQ